jgi:hypothetical protein
MIDGIRRRLGKTATDGSWESDQELNPEIEEDTGLPTDTTVSVVLAYTSGRYAPDNASTPDRYKSLVQTAIENGGRLGDHSISVPWLRMILAGLESKQIELKAMWYGIDPGETERGSVGDETRSYEDVFRSGRDAPGGSMWTDNPPRS